MIQGEGFGALQKKDYFLYNTVILEQRRQPETDFITPNPGRDGGNGIICLISGAIDYRMSDGPSCSATEEISGSSSAITGALLPPGARAHLGSY